MKASRHAVQQGAILPTVARQSVEGALRGGFEPSPGPTGDSLNARHGVFVTVREQNGELRGCAGTIVPACANLVAETWRSARLAAFHDSRFPPVTSAEVPNLRFNVSVLHSLEEVWSADELDPAHYGVVVSTADGRAGLLLPGIEEIRSGGQQLEIARGKGRIGPHEPVIIRRFEVDYFEDPAE